VTVIWSGLTVGAVYALVAIGYNVVYLATGAFNFAQAALMMVGVFVTYWGLATVHWPSGAVVAFAAVVVAVLAVMEERLAIRPVRGVEGHLVTTVGWATILVGGVEVVWGPDDRSVPSLFQSDSVRIFGGQVTPNGLFLMGLVVALAALIHVSLRRTMLGLSCLATSEDPEAAQLAGVNVRRLSILAFVVSGAVAGAVSIGVGPQTLAYQGLGSALALKGFAAMAVGGFGSISGAVVGGMATALVEALAARYLGGNYPNIAVFALLALVLLAKPTGALGVTKERVV
jgi:branched-chain amino acid transport system permease protein